MNNRYVLDKANGKLLGVCAGLANRTGTDPTVIRLIAVALTIFVLGPLAVLAYLLTALVADES